jgi:hypothetical protein
MQPNLPIWPPIDDNVMIHGISQRGAKGLFSLGCAIIRTLVTFEWISATDVGPLPVYITEYIVQYFTTHHAWATR